MTRLPKNSRGENTRVQSSSPGLTITATPIGNLGDLSPRAEASLQNADFIACEDTRHTGLMLTRMGITHGKLIAYHDHSNPGVENGLIAAMKDGNSVTLVSDAGTPLLSDPGFSLVRRCHDEGLNGTTIPGPSAMLAALVVSGLATDRFYFAGFMPAPAGKRRTELAELISQTCTIIIYESPKRLLACLDDLAELAPEREIAVIRELTKLHEDIHRGLPRDVIRSFQDTPPRGEIVLVIGPAQSAAKLDDDNLTRMVKRAMADGHSRRDAVRMVSDAAGIPKKHVYGLALGIDEDPDENEDGS